MRRNDDQWKGVLPADDDARVQVVRQGVVAQQFHLYMALDITREAEGPAWVEQGLVPEFVGASHMEQSFFPWAVVSGA